MADETPNTMSLREFCDHINVRPGYGSQLKRDGRLVFADDGRSVLVAESKARIAETRDPSKAGVAQRHAEARGGAADTGHDAAPASAPAAGAADAGGDSKPYQDSRAVKEFYSASRERLAYRKEAGELMERSAVVADCADAGATLRGALEAWVATLPPQLAGRDEAAVRGLLADQVEQVLHDLQDKLQRAAARASA